MAPSSASGAAQLELGQQETRELGQLAFYDLGLQLVDHGRLTGHERAVVRLALGWERGAQGQRRLEGM